MFKHSAARYCGGRDVRFVAKAQCSKQRRSFDHLVGNRRKSRRSPSLSQSPTTFRWSNLPIWWFGERSNYPRRRWEFWLRCSQRRSADRSPRCGSSTKRGRGL